MTPTIITCCRAFYGENAVKQRNAILSWRTYFPECRIVLFGEEFGCADFANSHGLDHIADTNRTIYDVPIAGNIIRQAESNYLSYYFIFISSDLIIDASFARAYKAVTSQTDRFIMVGNSLDLEACHPIDFTNPNWATQFEELTRARARLCLPKKPHYFVFSRGSWPYIPDLAVGRGSWKRWLMINALVQQVPLIDATQCTLPIHQLHDYKHTYWDNAERLSASREVKMELEESPIVSLANPFDGICLSLSSLGRIEQVTPQNEQLKEQYLAMELTGRAKIASNLKLQAIELIEVNEIKEALELIEAAYKLDIDGEGIRFTRAVCLLCSSRFEEAQHEFETQLSHPYYGPQSEQMISYIQSGNSAVAR